MKHFANQNRGDICVMLDFQFLQYGKLFGSHVLIRQLTGNRSGSTRCETGRKKIATATPLV